MRNAVMVVMILIVSLLAIAIVCAVNAPKWMDGKPVAATRAV